GVDRSVRLWDLATGRQTGVIAGLPVSVAQLAFSPDGQSLAVAGSDRVPRLVSVRTLEVRPLAADPDWVHSMCFSPDGRTLVAGGAGRVRRLFDFPAGSLKRIVRGQVGTINKVRFTPDGSQIVTASSDRTVRTWDAEGGLEALLIPEAAGGVHGL